MPYKEDTLIEQLAIEMFPGTEKEFHEIPIALRAMLVRAATVAMPYADRTQLSVRLDQKLDAQKRRENAPKVGDTVRFTEEALGVKNWYSDAHPESQKPRPDRKNHEVTAVKRVGGDVILDGKYGWGSNWLRVVR